MDKIESELQNIQIVPAPNTLDRRVAETVQAHNKSHFGLLTVRIPLSACAAACLICFAVGMLVRNITKPSVATPPASIVCSIEGGSAFAAVFAAEAAPDDYFLRKKRQINSQNTKGEI